MSSTRLLQPADHHRLWQGLSPHVGGQHIEHVRTAPVLGQLALTESTAAEHRSQPVEVDLGEGSCGNGAHVLIEVVDAAPSATEDHIATRLVAGEAVGSVDNRGGGRPDGQKTQGIVAIGDAGRVHGPLGDQVGDHRPADLGIGQRTAHGEHHEHADAARLRGGEPNGRGPTD